MFGFVLRLAVELFRYVFLELAKHYLYNLVRHFFRDSRLPKFGAKRSSDMVKRSGHWPTVEKHYRQAHPTCEICGSDTRLNVHHMQPFSKFPELELDPNNLITLCMDFKKECHLLIGHGDKFAAYNPNIKEDATYLRAHPEKFEEIAARAKSNRLEN